MSEHDATGQDSPGTSPDPASQAMRQSGKPIETGKCGVAVGGGKTSTVFGALFGAAAAVPT